MRLLRSGETHEKEETYTFCLTPPLSRLRFKEISFGVCLYLGAHTNRVSHFSCLTVKKDTHTHTLPQEKIREQTCRKLVWGFILVVFLIVVSYLFSVWPSVHKDGQNEWRERIKNERNVQRTLFPQWMESHTHTLGCELIWCYIPLWQTDRERERVRQPQKLSVS